MKDFSIQELINKELKRDEYKTQNTWYASSLGGCLCGIYLERLKTPMDEEWDNRTLRVFAMGKHIEDWIIELIKNQEGFEIKTQERVESKELNLSGKYDLYLKDIQTNKEFIYEIKSKHSRAFWWMDKKGEGAQDSHQMQLWTYLYLKNIKEGRIVYVSKDDLAILEYPVFLNNQRLKEQVLDQLSILNEAWEKKIPPLPAPEGSWQAKYCRCHKQCISQMVYLQKKPLFY